MFQRLKDVNVSADLLYFCVRVKKFQNLASVRTMCDSSDISFRCISAVSESPCSSDRLRESTREGERAKGGEQITKEADMMKERS